MPVTKLKIFISSVQREFKEQRRALKNFLTGDAFLRRYIFKVFLFEDIPAQDQRTDNLYLKEVENCNIYLGLFGYEYGLKDEHGISPTEYEYNHATLKRKTRLIYIWGLDDKKRSPKMKDLIQKATKNLVRRRVNDIPALTSEVYSSLVHYLDKNGALQVAPFDAAICKEAKISDISEETINWFADKANKERNYPYSAGASIDKLLIHLHLKEKANLLNAALLLFGKDPQSFFHGLEIKCIQCHGVEYKRPFIQQIYKGNLFEHIDSAINFVLSRINRSVGTRDKDTSSAANYELPRDAVAESIINAVAHRDYYSKGSVEVRLFSDRLEIWNPGCLPENLSIAILKKDHSSIPVNPLIAEPFYLARYIEKAGSGTQMIISECKAFKLPEPDFEQREGFFVVTLWRDWLTKDILNKLPLNDKQKLTIEYLKLNKQITNTEYQENFNVSKPTATRHLEKLVEIGVIEKKGTTGKGTYYMISHKGLIKGS